MSIETTSAAQTAALGETLGRLAGPGDLFALFGDLGAGKTTMTQGILRGLGIPGSGRSPTFTLINEYQGGRLPVYHMDAYRLNRPEELVDIGAEEYFYGEGLSVVEWAGRVTAVLPDERLDVYITAAGDSRRIFHLKAHGPRYERLLDEAAKEWGRW